MNYSSLIIGTIVIFALMATGYAIIPAQLEKGQPAQHEAIKETGADTYSFTDVSTHSDDSSCWTVVRGNVYDLTPFIQKHPGGAKNIMKICGIDGTELFENQHGGQNDPEETITEYYIGSITP